MDDDGIVKLKLELDEVLGFKMDFEFMTRTATIFIVKVHWSIWISISDLALLIWGKIPHFTYSHKIPLSSVIAIENLSAS